MAAEKGTADFYRNSAQDYLNQTVQLRVTKLNLVPELANTDAGFVWMEAVTGRPQKQEGKILIRIPQSDAVRLERLMNLTSTSGRWLEGVFTGHDSGPVLASSIVQKDRYYIQVTSSKAPKNSLVLGDSGPVSGSLVVAPGVRASQRIVSMPEGPRSAQPTRRPLPAQNDTGGPRVVLLRTKVGGPLEIRTANSVKMQAEFCEILTQDGKLSLVGKSLVMAVLPIPGKGVTPTQKEANAALQLYEEKSLSLPEATPLLVEAKTAWKKYAAIPTTTTGSPSLPNLEDVETAAGVEEPPVEAGYPAWFIWSAVGGTGLWAGLVWIWIRPRSTPA